MITERMQQLAGVDISEASYERKENDDFVSISIENSGDQYRFSYSINDGDDFDIIINGRKQIINFVNNVIGKVTSYKGPKGGIYAIHDKEIYKAVELWGKYATEFIKKIRSFDITKYQAVDPDEVSKGDYVDFGSKGKHYVLHKGHGKNGLWWVTKDKNDRYNENAKGSYIDAFNAISIIEKGKRGKR